MFDINDMQLNNMAIASEERKKGQSLIDAKLSYYRNMPEKKPIFKTTNVLQDIEDIDSYQDKMNARKVNQLILIQGLSKKNASQRRKGTNKQFHEKDELDLLYDLTETTKVFIPVFEKREKQKHLIKKIEIDKQNE